MKRILFTLLFCTSICSFSQESKYSIELNYPIQTGNTFISENYSGLIDLGFRARVLKTKLLNFGLQANCSVFDFDGNVKESSFKTLYVIQPKIYTELTAIEKIRPFVSIGYTLMTYRKSGDVDDGPNIGFGLSYDVSSKLFVQVQYDLIFAASEFDTRFSSFEGPLPDVLDSDNSIFKLGIGYRL